MRQTLKLTPNASLTVLESSPELLEVEATYGPGGDPPPAHLHPDQDERFEVLGGSVEVRLEGRERALATGETVTIPRGTPHQFWNPGPEPARVLWQTRPRGRTEEWFRAIDRLQREAGTGPAAMPDPAAFVELLEEYGDVFVLHPGPA